MGGLFVPDSRRMSDAEYTALADRMTTGAHEHLPDISGAIIESSCPSMEGIIVKHFVWAQQRAKAIPCS